MASTRRLILLGGIAALSLFAVPALASADVYCVDTGPAGCDHTGYTASAGLQQALDDALAHAGGDTVRIGSGTYATTASAGFNYNDPVIGNSVTVTGAGAANTVISVTAPGSAPGSFTAFYGLNIQSPGSVISQLGVTLPTPPGASSNQQYTAIQTQGSNTSVNTVDVQGPAAAINASGVRISGGTVTESTIALPLGFTAGTYGVWELQSSNDDVFVTHNTITADTGILNDNQSSGTVRIDRSRVRSSYAGVSAQASKVTLSNSLIDLGSDAGATGISVGYSNPFANTSMLSADGVTIYGSGNNQKGVVASGNNANTLPNPGDPDVATAAIANSIIRLTGTFPTSLQRNADHNGIVNLSTNYSDYDQTTIVDGGNPNGATGALTQQNQTSVDPGFVTPGTNFHLLSGSQLIDAGDPTGPPFGAQDIDGDDREILGKAGCAARRDIGFDEFKPGVPITPSDCTPPDTSFLSGPTGAITNTTPTFTFDSSEQPATFQCSLDGGSVQPCTSPFTSVPLADGPHVLAVQAIDGALNIDPTPASRSFTVDTTAPDTSIASHPKPKAKSRKATFTFSSTEPGSTFLCSYDGKPYAACGASFATPKLARGRHRFDVLSTDPVGNRDQSAATFLWKITKRKKRR
jgi:hypothetical protein